MWVAHFTSWSNDEACTMHLHNMTFPTFMILGPHPKIQDLQTQLHFNLIPTRKFAGLMTIWQLNGTVLMGFNSELLRCIMPPMILHASQILWCSMVIRS